MRRHYENPPIVEALVEVFFRGSQKDVSIPERFHQRIQDRFPQQQRLDQLGLEVNVAQGQAGARLSHEGMRFRFLSEDQSRMVQLADDLLVVNLLRPGPQVPYPSFEEWRPIVLEMLGLYQEFAQPEAIDRLGVRYINRVVIPELRFRMENYFRIYPFVPDDLADEHGPFLMRVEIPPQHPGHQLLVTFGSAPPEEEESTAHLLDFYDIVPMDPANGLKAVERPLDEAHENLVRAFEYSITDEARRLFREVPHDASSGA